MNRNPAKSILPQENLLHFWISVVHIVSVVVSLDLIDMNWNLAFPKMPLLYIQAQLIESIYRNSHMTHPPLLGLMAQIAELIGTVTQSHRYDYCLIDIKQKINN